MSVFFHFISGLYLKNFFIVFLALIFFFVGIDLVLNFNDLKGGANLTLLYILFLACSAASIILPLALVFALISTLINLIRSNELVSFYALGISKKQVILYPFLWALFFCFVFVALNFTPFAYANDYVSNIRKQGILAQPSENIFLKFNGDFIYIQNYEPLQKKAQKIEIFSFSEGNLSQIIKAESAIFKENSWQLEGGNKINLPKNPVLFEKGLSENNFSNSNALENFNTQFVQSANTEASYTLYELWQNINIFKEQGLNTTNLRLELYKLIFTPFFAPFLMLILFIFFPTISRFFNLAFMSFIFFLSTLIVWGIISLGVQLGENNALLPEIALILPVLLIALCSGVFFVRAKT